MRIVVRALWITTGLLCASTSLVEAASKNGVLEYIRSKTVRNEPYQFGTDREFTLRDDEGLLLECSENTDGVGEILICVTNRFHNRRVLFIYCVHGEGIAGGGSPLSRIDRAFRVVETCAAVAGWRETERGLTVSFVLTDDRELLGSEFKDAWKRGRFSLSGDLQGLVDLENDIQLDADERLEVFVRLWTAIRYNFANFDLVPELDWDAVLSEGLALVRRNQSNREFARFLVRTVAALKDGHTDVGMKFFGVFGSAQPALKVQPIEGKAIITEVGMSEDIAAAALQVGDEILTIDGKAVQNILNDDIYPYIFASTDQWRDRIAFRRLLKGSADSEVRLLVRRMEEEPRNVVVVRNVDWGRYMPQKKYADLIYQELDGDICYVALNSFGNSNIVDKFREHMGRIREHKGLIIDVRKNGGGNSGNGDRIVSFLIDEPIEGSPWMTPQYVAAFEAWGRPRRWYVGEPEMILPCEDLERFAGPIVVLTGSGTCSAAEDFLVLLHSSGRAVLVGERSSGSTGQPLRFEFGFGVRGRICTKRNTYPDGREFVGIGVIPDVEIHPTQHDITGGRDAVLERGIDLLRECLQ